VIGLPFGPIDTINPMKDPVTPLAAAMLAIAVASFSPGSAVAEQPGGRPPVVVELFTSQGCSSCPPADEVLAELTTRPDVLPLSFHVTYWDRLGWPDTLGLTASTERQRVYARAMGNDGLYTPQMVIDGRIDVVGSRRQRVLEAIDLLASDAAPSIPIAIEGSRLQLGAGRPDQATVWLFAVDEQHDVRIMRGENRGRTVPYHNVVREVIELAPWSGDPLALTLPLDRLAADGRDGAAILVQRRSGGEILAAAYVDVARRNAR
jgi:hypothetical protein